MGFSCLLGHDFGHPEHEQEREQHGEEVVLTTRDVKTCRRCGTEQVLTENTAVMKRDAVPAAVELDEAAEADTASADEPTATDARSTDEPTEADIGPTTETANPNVEPTTETAALDDPTSITDRADTPERSDVSTPETRQSDGIDTIDTPTDPEPEITHDAVILTDEPEERDPMAWPEFGTEGKTSTPTTDTGQRGTVTDGGTTSGVSPAASRLYCESCTSTWNPGNSSLLVGDPCPNCRSAYVDRR